MSTTIDPLSVAKTLLLLAKEQCQKTERFACTAGLILLEQALQTILFACLAEKDVRVEENISFLDLVIAVEQSINPAPFINKRMMLGLNASCEATKTCGNTVDQHTAMEFFTGVNEAIGHLIFITFGKSFLENEA